MGFSISWYAVREGGAQKLLDRLGLSPTGETEESRNRPFRLSSSTRAGGSSGTTSTNVRFSGPRTSVSFRMTRKC